MKLKKGDPVIVIAGKDKGKEGNIAQVLPTTTRSSSTASTPPRSTRRPARPTSRAGSSTRTCRSMRRTSCIVSKGKPTRLGYPHRSRRHQGPHRQAHRGGHQVSTTDHHQPATAEAEVRRRGAPGDPGAARARQRHAGAEAQKIVVNMGVGRATQQPSLLEGAVKDLTAITGQKPIVTKAKTLGRGVQAARGPVDRLQGHPPGRSDVGVPRPADRRGDPPHP